MSAFRPPEIIESDELLWRPPEPGDAQALFDEMFSDPQTMRHLTYRLHRTLDETRAFIALSELEWKAGAQARWVLQDKATGRLTALVELKPWPPRAEIGVMISRRGGARRRRAGIDSLRKFLRWLIAQPQIYRVFACCSVDGDAHSAMERLGFTLEAKLTNYEYRPNLPIPVGDSYLYAMTRPFASREETKAIAWVRQYCGVDMDMGVGMD